MPRGNIIPRDMPIFGLEMRFYPGRDSILPRIKEKPIKRKIKQLLLALVKNLVIVYHRLVGPPKTLSYNMHTNIALLRALGASVGE